MAQFILDVKKALVPLTVSGIVVVLKAVGVEIPVADEYVIAAGLVNSGFVWLAKNGVPFFSAE